jgi:hypothetical protein
VHRRAAHLAAEGRHGQGHSMETVRIERFRSQGSML